MFTLSSRLNIVLVLLLAVSTQATAITVFDVIQLSKKNYGDQEIIALIEATDSAFELKADDVTRLADLGIGEPVIQAMLKAVPAEPAHNDAPDKYVTNPGSATTISEKYAPSAVIDSEPLTEPDSGRHHHQVITLSGIRLFVLRDEGGYPSVTARADAVTNQLRKASAMGGGQFKPVHVTSGDAVMYTEATTARTLSVISVSAQDASAYQQRSGRQVTPDLLAAYWSDLLTDYWSLAHGDPPVRLAELHEGEALQELYGGLDAAVKNNADRLTGAFQSLPKQERDHLLQLAMSVPRDFNTPGGHEDEEP